MIHCIYQLQLSESCVTNEKPSPLIELRIHCTTGPHADNKKRILYSVFPAGATAQSATISNKSPSPENTIKSNNRIGGGGNGTGGGGNGGGAVDFADELAAKLTLKKQKNISNSSTNNNNNNNAIVNSNNSINNQVPVTESNLRTNRGPPPQPPVQLLKVNVCGAALCWMRAIAVFHLNT